MAMLVLQRWLLAALIGSLSCLSHANAGLAKDGSPKKWRFEPIKSSEVKLSSNASLKTWIAQSVSDKSRKVRITWALFTLDYKFDVVIINKTGWISDLLEAADCSGDLIMTGGFSRMMNDQRVAANGWVVSNSIEASPIFDFNEKMEGGTIVYSDNQVRIIRSKDLPMRSFPEQALQSTPLLIFEGKFDGADDADRRRLRSVIGLTRQKEIIAALVYGDGNETVSLAETGAILLEFSTAAQIEVSSVLALDAGYSGRIYAKQAKRHFGNDKELFLPNAICVRAK